LKIFTQATPMDIMQYRVYIVEREEAVSESVYERQPS